MKLRTLPILEQWDCHHCTACCRETTIRLNADDLARLEQQKWEQHPQYCGTPVVRRSALLGGARVLAHQADGSCVFLTELGRCRIHEVFGADAKPLMCQLFPLQVVTTDRSALATVVRSCPSAAAGQGRPLGQHLAFLQQLLGSASEKNPKPAAPPVLPRAHRSWDDFHRVSDSLQRLLVDNRLPLVRRLVHCLQFCKLLEQSQWKRVETKSKAELIGLLEQSASEDAGRWFADRHPPAPRTARLFRRLGAHFIRCYPGGRPTRNVFDHWRVFRLSGRLARASTLAPELHPQFPAMAMERLERPLGPLTGEVLRPLDGFFESHAVSKRYSLARPGRPLVESVRRLAFAFPISLWMLRWLTGQREPAAEDTVKIVVAVERGLELPALGRAASFLAESGELERLLAWYSR